MEQDDIVHVVDVDIVSDVVCPWCIIGFLQLRRALAMTGLGARVRWHPFELNPDMGPEGQDLAEHMAEKSGTSAEDSHRARDRLRRIGAQLGFAFNYDDTSRMVNTFRAHQLLDWAAEEGLQHPLKMALFAAYFTDQQDVSDIEVLIRAAQAAGLDGEAAREGLTSGARADLVRRKQAFWVQNGISGVPTMCIGGKFVLTGAQEAETYADVIRQAAQLPAA